MTSAVLDAEYRHLLAEFLPHTIQNSVELRRMEARIGELLALSERTAAQDALLDLLSTLVEAWEREHVSIPQLGPIDLVKSLCEEAGLRQRDLVPIFGTESIVSEVLSGKRRLQMNHISGLAALFKVSPAAFISVAASNNDGVNGEPVRKVP